MLKLLKTVIPTLWISLALALTACGGGAGGDKNNGPKKSASPNLSFKQIKTFAFSWSDVSDATHYKLLENADGKSGFNQVGSNIPQGDENFDHYVPLHKRVNAQYILQSCNTDGCTDSDTISVTGNLVESIGYVKASVKDSESVPSSGALNESDDFGTNVALSDDGKTMAVGAPGESSNAVGINGDEADDSALYSGAVYIFNKGSNNIWVQQAYIKPQDTTRGDKFGISLALSGDGKTLAVANDAFNNALEIFTLGSSNDARWTSRQILEFTSSIRRFLLSDKGDVLIVPKDELAEVHIYSIDEATSPPVGDSNFILKSTIQNLTSVGISLSGNGNSLAIFEGFIHIYTPDSLGFWIETDLIRPEDTSISYRSLSFSDDGNTLVASGLIYFEDVAPVVIFDRDSSGQWSQQEINISANFEVGEGFSSPVNLSISGDGNTLAIGSHANHSNARGIGGDSDNSSTNSGAVLLYSRTNNEWQQTAFVKASNSQQGDSFGGTISLSADGNTLAVGAPFEDSSSIGIGNGDQENNDATDSGAVYLF